MLPILVIITIIDLELQFRDYVELGIFQIEMIYLSFAPSIYAWKKIKQKPSHFFHWTNIYWILFTGIIVFYTTAISLALWFTP